MRHHFNLSEKLRAKLIFPRKKTCDLFMHSTVIIRYFSKDIKNYVAIFLDNYAPNSQATVRVKPKAENLSWRLPSASSVIESD